MKTLLEYCEAHVGDTIADIEALARLESPSTDKAAVDRCGAELEARLRVLGATVERLHRAERGDHLAASWSGDEPGVLLLR